jgi:DNA-binding SARP family transcriptional activator
MLVMERRHGVTRDALANAVWPEGLPDTWSSALRSVISRVRAFVAQALAEEDGDVLVARGGVYLLRLPADTIVDVELAENEIAAARDAVDRHRFEVALRSATEATRRLRGPFLTDHDSEWVRLQREHLGDLLVTGLEVACRAASALGDGAVSLSAALEATQLAPLRESAHRCLMAAHAAAGNRAQALRAYQRLRRMLAEELGVDPDAETEAAYLQLLGAPPLPPPHPDGARGLLEPGTAAPFVGREPELAAAEAVWARAATATQVVLLSGEAGVGKTRLAVELGRRVAADGALVMFGRCDPEAIIPYQPFAEVLDGFVVATPDAELPDLSAAARSELATAFPSFAGTWGTRRPPDRSVLFDAVTELVASAGTGHRLLIVLDDLQWADADTSLLLRYLLRHASSTRLMVVAITRSDLPPSHPLSETIHSLDRDGLLHHIRLGGLDRAAGTAMVQELFPGAGELLALVPKLVADTSGNPFMLIELLRAYRDDAPATPPVPEVSSAGLDDLVAGRLRIFDPGARRLLEAASVIGGSFELDVAASAAMLDEPAAAEAVDVALASGLVVDAGVGARTNQYRFAHELVRRTLYRRLGRATRSRLHGRVADALEELESETLVNLAPRLAHHRCAGAAPGGDVRAVRWALAAAAQAYARGASTDAQRRCRQALEHVPAHEDALEAEVLTALGLAQAQGGDPEGEQTLLDGAIRARVCGRIDIAARAVLGVADLARRLPRLRGEATALVGDVLTSEPPPLATHELQPQQVLWARLVARQFELGRSPADVDSGQVATAASILTRRLRGLGGPDHLEARSGVADDLRTIADVTHNLVSQLVTYHHRAMVATVVGDGDVADDALASMTNAVHTLGHQIGYQLLEEHAITQAISRGTFVDAAGTISAGEVDELGLLPPGAMASRQLLVARWLQGRLGEEATDGVGTTRDLSEFGAAEEALVALARGDQGRAKVAVRTLTSGAEPLPTGDAWLHAVGLLGLAAVDLGDPVIAADVRRLLAPYATLRCAVGYRSFVSTAAFHLGRLAALLGDFADAERHLVLALRQLSATGAQPWIALTQHALAYVLDVRGRSSDRERVSVRRAEAQRLAADLGLRPLDVMWRPPQ